MNSYIGLDALEFARICSDSAFTAMESLLTGQIIELPFFNHEKPVHFCHDFSFPVLDISSTTLTQDICPYLNQDYMLSRNKPNAVSSSGEFEYKIKTNDLYMDDILNKGFEFDSSENLIEEMHNLNISPLSGNQK